MKKRIILVLVLIIAVILPLLWYYSDVGNRAVIRTTEREAQMTRALVNERCDRLEARLMSVESQIRTQGEQLGRIERKLDTLLDLAIPKLPDGMRPAK